MYLTLHQFQSFFYQKSLILNCHLLQLHSTKDLLHWVVLFLSKNLLKSSQIRWVCLISPQRAREIICLLKICVNECWTDIFETKVMCHGIAYLHLWYSNLQTFLKNISLSQTIYWFMTPHRDAWLWQNQYYDLWQRCWRPLHMNEAKNPKNMNENSKVFNEFGT